MKRDKAAKASPIAREIAKIRGGSPVAPVLRLVVGDALAERTVTAAVRVRHLGGTGEGRKPAQNVSHRGTARVEFAPEQVRPTTALCVRRLVMLLLMIVEQLPRSGGARIISPKLWLGPHTGPGVGESLAARIGCSVRELERYLVVLRQAGVLRAWQPPDGALAERFVGARSGKAFNCYQLCGEIPRELLLLLRPAYAAEARAMERAKDAPAPVALASSVASFMVMVPVVPESTSGPPIAAPPPPPRRATSATAVASFLRMVPSS